jgi:hypothetical protein
MQRLHEWKGRELTLRDLMVCWQREKNSYSDVVWYRKKSAEAIVPGNLISTMSGDYKKGRAEC